jgi:hypothetical protein
LAVAVLDQGLMPKSMALKVPTQHLQPSHLLVAVTPMVLTLQLVALVVLVVVAMVLVVEALLVALATHLLHLPFKVITAALAAALHIMAAAAVARVELARLVEAAQESAV